MEQKQRFVSLAGSGHFTVTELCREFGISRKTGHKWLGRHAQGGMKALEDRSRAPLTVTCRTPAAIERLIVAEKRLHPTWGPKKIRRVLETKHGVENPPVVSTVGEVLKRHGMVAERRRRGGVFKAERGALTAPERCNHVLGEEHRDKYNRRRPHSSLGDLTPAEFAAACLTPPGCSQAPSASDEFRAHSRLPEPVNNPCSSVLEKSSLISNPETKETTSPKPNNLKHHQKLS